ncbi:RNA polymerase sigma factor sigE, chloroplastic/mitochondrial-like isoform X5 [Tasmannia lanceolata]|uniref:RNA polymerase sigma factor sigE, chloroplastic/mitochondrial-like isoform X5 n=1 Tax=Tasmannia lanceolata TaxID=3420 RepID=UPI004062DF71
MTHWFWNTQDSFHSPQYSVLRQLGMGVMTVSSSASQTPLGASARFSTHHSTLRRPIFLAFKTDKSKTSAFVAPQEAIPLPVDTPKEHKKSPRRATKSPKRVETVFIDGTSPCTIDLDYNEAAAKLESIYKLSPADIYKLIQKCCQMRKRTGQENEKGEKETTDIVKSRSRKMKRLSLGKRIFLRKMKNKEAISSSHMRGDVKRTFSDYSSTDFVSLDWKKMKIPAVLPSSEHARLFQLMQPMKALLEVKENMHKGLGREPTDDELATANNMNITQMRRHIEVGRSARSKLIKVRMEIQRAKLELLFELGRLPTEEELIAKVGISTERYHDVMRASKPVFSLHARHVTTQEEFIKGITDIDGVGGDKRKQHELLRLALDDVLDSLKPKESLVIRQRYGLDGKGDRTLGEIAGNLNISREMVRKYEVKAFMKLKHPTRVDYLRRYIV